MGTDAFAIPDDVAAWFETWKCWLHGDSSARDDQFVTDLKDWLLADVLASRGIRRQRDAETRVHLTLVSEAPAPDRSSDDVARDEDPRERRAA